MELIWRDKVRNLDELLHETFVAAMEGGVDYWAEVLRYRWSIGDGEIPDLEGFRAELRDAVGGKPEEVLVVDRAVILRGFERLAKGEATFGGKPLDPRWKARAAGWLAAPASADLDANDADVVVQAGLFGDVVYG